MKAQVQKDEENSNNNGGKDSAHTDHQKLQPEYKNEKIKISHASTTFCDHPTLDKKESTDLAVESAQDYNSTSNQEKLSDTSIAKKNEDKDINLGNALGSDDATFVTRVEDTVEGCGYPEIPNPCDPARILDRRDLQKQRILFWTMIAIINIGMALVALSTNAGIVVFVVMPFYKSKDFLSCIISAIGLSSRYIYRLFRERIPEGRFILS